MPTQTAICRTIGSVLNTRFGEPISTSGVPIVHQNRAKVARATAALSAVASIATLCLTDGVAKKGGARE
jgi:hypothetical protein